MRAAQDLLERRNRLLGQPYRLFYDEPLHLVRGEGVWLADAAGRRYLDAYNNVACVGHCHPHVVEALATQAATLNTHTRYLSEPVLDYAEHLLSTLPGELNRIMLTCTGSEANDLACRIARAWSGGDGFIVTENAYHGVTAAVAALSPSLGPDRPRSEAVAIVAAPRPDVGPSVADRFAAEVQRAIQELGSRGVRPAALLVDTVFSSDGVLPEPAGFLAPAVAAIRQAGGLFIADEVQAGFGRTGRMWGMSRHDVDADIVTMGKPMGNGHPVGGIAVRREVLESFAAQTRYFNTFAGNPVSAAVGKAVLEVIADERLVDHAAAVGQRLARDLEHLRARHAAIADVRAAGLFLGLQLADAPGRSAAARTSWVVNRLRHRGVLVGITGPHGDVVKIRPPLVFADEHAELLVSVLDDVLAAEATESAGAPGGDAP